MTEVEIFKQNLDVSRVVMLITIVMAVTSVVFSALTMAFERSHNKRSVKPFCNLVASIDSGSMHLTIKNAGMGTMILRTISIVSASGEEISIVDFRKRYKNYVIDMLQITHEIGISINEELNILRIKDCSTENTSEDLNECRIVIRYSDIYNQDYKNEIKIIDIKRCAS